MRYEDILTCVISDDERDNESLGRYDIKFHNSSVDFEGVNYVYHSSGLARVVYISPERDFVLKIPACEQFENDLERWKIEGKSYLMSVAASHNIYEAKCYHDAPKKFKKYMAKTELLSNCWVKQEFVEVLYCGYNADLREIGRIGKRFVLFDMDIMLSDFIEPKRGFNYEILPEIIKKAGNLVKIKSKNS